MKEVSPKELMQWIEQGKKLFLIDVREAYEREAFNIGGVHIPIGEAMERKEEFKREIPVVVYCEKGIRSAIIIQRLGQMGFENLYNLSGGMSAWKSTSF
ncbi:MAG TPA: rhodanese-like domain-containing protein [Flavipsychrobacter sp.]|nr:rhodanese-like domain-containing protein [Flavipsychrobacter sp.]